MLKPKEMHCIVDVWGNVHHVSRADLADKGKTMLPTYYSTGRLVSDTPAFWRARKVAVRREDIDTISIRMKHSPVIEARIRRKFQWAEKFVQPMF